MYRSRSPIFAPIENSLCDFLLVSNLPPILHRFRDIAFDRYKTAIFGYPSCTFNSPTEEFPWDDLRKRFRGCQGMAKVPTAIEILRKINTARVAYTSVTDDRQTTNGRAIDSVRSYLTSAQQ